MSTSANSVFAVRFAHANAFDTSQARKTLYAIAHSRRKYIDAKALPDTVCAIKRT